MIFSQSIAAKFDDYFIQYNGSYFIRDLRCLSTNYNKKSGKIKTEMWKLALNIEIEGIKSQYLKNFEKPKLDGSKQFVQAQIRLRPIFLYLASIRQITLIQEGDNDTFLNQSKCTCPDFFSYKICVYLIACLIKREKFEFSVAFQATEEKGKKSEDASSLQSEVEFKKR